MKSIIYFIIVVLTTAIILTGLFFYNKGNSKELNAQLKINDEVTLDVNKATSRPLDNAKYHLIFYVKAHNDSDQVVDLREKPLSDPCANLINSSYNNDYNNSNQPYRSPTPIPTLTPSPSAENNYQLCIQGEAYKSYVQGQKEYQDSLKDPKTIELWTPQSQKCEIDNNYTINQRYPNLGHEVTNYYEPKQSRVGSLVYTCPEKIGNFTLKYNDENVIVSL